MKSFLLNPMVMITFLGSINGLLLLTNKLSLKIKKYFSIFSLIVIYFLSTTFISNPILFSIENNIEYNKSIPAELPEHDAIAVLGGGISDEEFSDPISRIGSTTLKRLIFAINIQKKSGKILIIHGGRPKEENVAEAVISATISSNLGLQKDKMIIEDKSKTTWENIMQLKKIMADNKFKKVILVTSAMHIKRALFTAKKFDIEVIPFATDYTTAKKLSFSDFIPSPEHINKNRIFIYEILGQVKYFFKKS